MTKQHNRLTSFFKTPFFLAREYLHRKPDPSFDWHFAPAAGRALAAREIENLKREGILLLPGYFQGAFLEELRAGFERVASNHPNPYDPDSHLNMDFLCESPVFLKAALDDYLLEILGGYYGKKFALGRAQAMRHLPTPPIRYGSYQWHHDARGRQIHAMILLTDLKADGQKMSYLRQSHHRYYDHFRGLGDGSRFEKDMQDRPDLQSQVMDITGPAGTVALFDSNGLHTGYRNETARRDILLFYYVTSRHFRKLRYLRRDIDALDPVKRRIITGNPLAELVSESTQQATPCAAGCEQGQM